MQSVSKSTGLARDISKKLCVAGRLELLGPGVEISIDDERVLVVSSK